MHEVKAIFKPDRLNKVLEALHQIPELPGITVSTVKGFGKRQPAQAGAIEFGEVAMTKLEIVVPDSMLAEVLERIRHAANTGHPGDGKIFVLGVEQAMRIRSGEQGVGIL